MNYATIMDKSVCYTPTARESEAVKKSVHRFFDTNFPHYIRKGTGIEKMFGEGGTFWTSKGWIISAMEKSPYYNGNYQIVVEKTLKREIKDDVICEFIHYLGSICEEWQDDYYNAIWAVLVEVKNRKVKYVDDQIVGRVNSIELKSVNKEYIKKAVHFGRKITKVINDLAGVAGFSCHSDIREVEQDGRKVKKDFGWNRQFAELCDNISPTEVKETVVISVHPRDYLGIADGDNWTTCYCTDKRNKSRYSYSGGNCNATLSYMSDSSTIVVYSQIKTDKKHPELLPKHRCCLFYLGEDKIVQSRVYPDCRDHNFESAKTLREVVQMVVADIFDIPNYWGNIKGTDICEKILEIDGNIVYPDHKYFNDCNVSFARRIDGYKNENKICIGTAKTICPECGELHTRNANLFCDDCEYDFAVSYLMSLGWNKDGAEAIADALEEDCALDGIMTEELEEVSDDYKDR